MELLQLLLYLAFVCRGKIFYANNAILANNVYICIIISLKHKNMYDQTDDGAPNALKWTPERVKEILNNIIEDATEQEVSFLNMALVRQGLYKEIWAYWRKVFARDPDIQVLMKRIDSIFETKLYHSALHKEVSPWVAIFGLKYNHKWNIPETTEETKREPEPELPGKKKEPLFIIKLPGDKILIDDDDPGHAGIYQKVKSEPVGSKSGEDTGEQKPTHS
jgi:hypothetical protein